MATSSDTVMYPQTAMLDLLVPGFSLAINGFQTLSGIDVSLYLPYLCGVSGGVWFWSYTIAGLRDVVKQQFSASVRVNASDEIYDILMGWIAQQKLSNDARHFIASISIVSRDSMIWNPRERSRLEDENGADDDDNKTVHYTPSCGTHYFWYKNRPMAFTRIERERHGRSGEEELRISCLVRDPQPLKELIAEARSLYVHSEKGKTLIYRPTKSIYGNVAEWKRSMARSPRPFSTVILDETTKERLVEDIGQYLKPSTRRWYAHRGIPYRRGYLFHGPPSTGKTSLSMALAFHFQMRIYVMNLNSPLVSEDSISKLFNDLPRRCVVLLEDVDSAGLTLGREVAVDDSTASNESSRKKPETPRLSLSSLLNILDGVASQEGRVLLMTTNHIENLDPALIRPGRVDTKIHFGLVDKHTTAAIFRAIYLPYDKEKTPSYGGDKSIKELSEVFAAKIPELEFSPAEIQGLLLSHKSDPAAAIDEAESWVEQSRENVRKSAEREEEQ